MSSMRCQHIIVTSPSKLCTQLCKTANTIFIKFCAIQYQRQIHDLYCVMETPSLNSSLTNQPYLTSANSTGTKHATHSYRPKHIVNQTCTSSMASINKHPLPYSANVWQGENLANPYQASSEFLLFSFFIVHAINSFDW